MNLRNQKISVKWQLIAVCVLLAAAPIIILVVTGYKAVQRETYQQIEDLLNNEALLIAQNAKTVYENAQNKVTQDLNVAREYFYSYGAPYIDNNSTTDIAIENQITAKVENISLAAMKMGEDPLLFNYTAVDRIQKSIGGAATIFQVVPQGLLRISTNVLKLDGARAVGTYIPTDSDVYKTIMRGETYTGRAFVVNAWYLTAYEPIKDPSGKIIGSLFIGVKESDHQDVMLNSLSKALIGKTGYIWVLDSEGNYILSKDRARDGENIWETKDADGVFFIQEMINNAKALGDNQSYVHYYPWKNNGEKDTNMKVSAVTYMEEWDWIIGPSAYQEEFLEGLNSIKKQVILIAILSIIAAILIAFLLARYISNPLGLAQAVIAKVRNGLLGERINLKSNIKEIKNISDDFDGILEDLNDKQKIDESFLYSISDPGFKTDINLTVTEINDAFLNLLEYSREEVVGKMKCTHLCKNPLCGTENCVINKCLKTKSALVVETEVKTKSGKLIPVRISGGGLYNSKKEAVGGFELIQDISVLKSIIANTEEVAKGNLTIKIPEEYQSLNNTTGKLAKAVDIMVQQLSQLIFNIKKQITGTAVSSEQMSVSSDNINSAIQQISSTVQQIAAGSQNVSKVVVESKDASNKTAKSAEKGKEAAKLVSEKMGDINTTIKIEAEKIKALGEKSKEISNIVNTINNITSQTNLLALNASIEAARAGEAGRGFAVVADEVRKLAEESEKATEQISELTTNIQSEINSSVNSMEKNAKQVDEGYESVENALKSFDVIPELVDNINKALIEVSSVTEQNAAGSSEVSSAVQQTSASMQQISSTAKMLSAEAEKLKDMVASFRINDSEINDAEESGKTKTI